MQSANEISIQILIHKSIFFTFPLFYFLWARLSAHTPTRAAPGTWGYVSFDVSFDFDYVL